jgi:predicted nucleic acid-binding protein
VAGPLIYADASAIMRLVDGDEPARQRVETLLRQHGGNVATSVISMIECRSKPLRNGDTQRVSAYDAFFSSRDLTLFPVDSAVAERATQLRAKYNPKTPDAIHIATAAVHGASLVVTTDHDFARCRDLPGMTIEVVSMS